MGDLAKHDWKKDPTSNIMRRAFEAITEGLTGLAASDRKEMFLSLGHVLQRTRSGGFLRTLHDEWEGYRAKGRIADDYAESEQHQECLQEILDFLDRDLPDETRFTLLKKVLLVAATEANTSRRSALPQQYMRICRGLSSGEVLVLLAVYARSKLSPGQISLSSAQDWIRTIAEDSGLEYESLVEIHEETLISKHLLTQRTHNDRSGVSMGTHFRLTDLGYAICQYVEAYEPPDAKAAGSQDADGDSTLANAVS